MVAAPRALSIRMSYDQTGTIVTLGLTGVADVQALNIHLAGIQPGNGTADIAIDILWGDVDHYVVNSADVALVQQNFTQAVTQSTALYDINGDGVVNRSDVALVNAALGTSLLTQISSVSVSGITGTAATIAWTTDEPSSSQVQYGTMTSYGSASTLNSSLLMSHSVTLTGLAPSTVYNFAAVSTNAAGTATSGNLTFTTGVAAPVISAVTSSASYGDNGDDHVDNGSGVEFAGELWNHPKLWVQFGSQLLAGCRAFRRAERPDARNNL